MNVKKKGLGKGLGDLGLNELLSSIKETAKGKKEHGGAGAAVLRRLPIALLKPGKYQPRQAINQETLAELAESIKAQGVLQPILARPISDGNYEIIAGERRWRAAQLAGLENVPVIVHDLSNQQVVAVALIENIQREDLNAIDAAVGLQRLIDEFGMTHKDVAEAVGKSRVTVTNLLRLLGLADAVKKMLQDGSLEMGHARALLTLMPPIQVKVAREIVLKSLSVRATEKLVQNLQHNSDKRTLASPKKDPNVLQLQTKLQNKLGAQVKIEHAEKGKGKLVIYYNSLEELDGILGHIR